MAIDGATWPRGWLIEHASPKQRAQLEAHAQLPSDTVARFDAARRRWLHLALEPEACVAWIAARLPEDRDALDALADLHLDDLMLAYGCCAGSSEAIAEFDRLYATEIRSAAKDADPSTRTEFEQRLRELLFVPTHAKLREYGGRGSLGSWLRIVARRSYLNFARSIGRRREVPSDDERLMDDTPASDPELAYLKAHYRGAFREAFARAMAELTPRERNLLRQHLVHALTIDELGRLYDVHRSTAARWLTQAREAVLARTRAQLIRSLGVDSDELQSIMRLIGSRLDVTVSRHLRPETGG